MENLHYTISLNCVCVYKSLKQYAPINCGVSVVALLAQQEQGLQKIFNFW